MDGLKEPIYVDVHVNDNATFIMSPVKTGTKIDGFQRKGEAWFVATELQSDLTVEVGGLNFHLHKFPLLSRSGRINRLVFESRDAEKTQIVLAHMSGGAEAFELAARFCYGMPVDLSASNVAAVRCMADYLEMSDDLEEGNLISKAETFINNVVLQSWKRSISVLKTCERLSPWAEDLKIVQRCCESIAWKACTDPRGVRSPGTKITLETKNHPSFANDTIGFSVASDIAQDWWFDDVVSLEVGHFTKVIVALAAKGMRPESIGSVIVHYSLKWLPAVAREYEIVMHDPEEVEGERSVSGSGISDSVVKGFSTLHRQDLALFEHIVRILPREDSAIPSKFLIRLIKIANMLDADAGCKADLEKRVGSQLDHATLDDLLIPSFCSEYETLFDVELVLRLVEYFLITEQSYHSNSSPSLGLDESPRTFKPRQAAKLKVAKLLDSYLSEIARDRNLSLTKFESFAELIPDGSRLSHDGLYRAIDIFLKTHPRLTEHERKKVCRIMDCQKLSLQACVHAFQNERLPLRTVVQVLFCDYIKVRNALARRKPEEFLKSDDNLKEVGLFQTSLHPSPNSEGLAKVNEEMKLMRLEMDNLKQEVSEVRSQYSRFHEEMHHFAKHKTFSTWITGFKKLSKLAPLHHSHHEDDHRASAKEDITSPNRAEHHKDH
ncbi:hypothetical protein O6H91_06G058800 [Diphasiastrum complanatum]|uniref:Uncharacterized protein n=1 Tax=Diphasiastrum complanatum TaxID=34168 RepID=A0ACC2DE95_DIPCM|nr:hypothetical protein O6H91_06G058800 [Diphasiastrum complanatum]